VRGWGETRGERATPERAGASALAFGSEQRRSLIRHGSGYWRYVPTDDGTLFLTRYDYEPRWGLLGRLADRVAFRPLIGWATAWSFDRLRLWLEEDIAPEQSLRTALVHAAATWSLAAAWLYQGLVPKLLVRDSGEREIVRGVLPGHEDRVLVAAGAAEIAFAVAILARGDRRWPWLANLAVLPALAAGAVRSDRSLFVRPFNPAALSVAMIGLGVVGLLARSGRPSARRCRRAP
jgi:DoxX-like protein